MTYIRYNELLESEFDNIISRKDEVQYKNINQIKLEVHGTYKKR